MNDFYANLATDDAERLDRLAKLNALLRDNRAALLAQYLVADEAVLLEKVRAGEVPEHPAYDHYLAARLVQQMRQSVRAELDDLLRKVRRE
jgi:hypothetical protein